MPNPSKLDQEIAARRAERDDPEPLYASETTGLDLKVCVLCEGLHRDAGNACDRCLYDDELDHWWRGRQGHGPYLCDDDRRGW